MAKQSKPTERVALRSPKGVKVTVSKESAEKYKARGYKAAGSTSKTSTAS